MEGFNLNNAPKFKTPQEELDFLRAHIAEKEKALEENAELKEIYKKEEDTKKIIDLAKKMIRLAGFIPDKDINIKIIGLRPGEKLYEELLNDTSKTLPTHHEKIMIAQDLQEEFESLHLDIDELIGIANFFENDDIVMKMKKIGI